MKLVRRFIPVALVLQLPLLVVGCGTINKVSVVCTGAAGGGDVRPGPVRSYAKFTDIKEDYRIQGMISTLILPLMKNKSEAREALAQEIAAGLGVNSLVGLTSLNHPYLNDPSSKYAPSCAILVNTGAQPGENQPARPKFIVCVLPVRVKTDKTKPASRLEPFITPELQFHLAQKGYYAYRCTASAVDVTGLAAEMELPAELKEPLGVVPDFVLTCEIEQGGIEFGGGLKNLRMRVVLYDLQRKMNVWEDVQSMVGWSLLDLLIDPNLKWSVSEGEFRESVHTAVELAVKKLSLVSGYGELKK